MDDNLRKLKRKAQNDPDTKAEFERLIIRERGEAYTGYKILNDLAITPTYRGGRSTGVEILIKPLIDLYELLILHSKPIDFSDRIEHKSKLVLEKLKKENYVEKYQRYENISDGITNELYISTDIGLLDSLITYQNEMRFDQTIEEKVREYLEL